MNANTELERLANRLGIAPGALGRFIDFYNEDYSQYGNEIYERVETRAAHWLNAFSPWWFNRRLSYLAEGFSGVDSVVDIGFSVPYHAHPMFSRAYAAGPRTYLLVDKYSSAQSFNQVVGGADPSRGISSRVVIADIEDPQGAERVVEALGMVSPSRLLVVGSEVVEHLENPDSFWELGRRLAREVAESCLFYVTLPIGDPIPSHRSVFRTAPEAREYLGRRLQIEDEQIMEPSSDERATPYLRACYCAFGMLRPAED